jgi:DNA-binding SARP family transcriptional activator
VQLAVLGPVRALRDGSPVELGAPRQRALLTALILQGGRPASADALIDLLWGDAAPSAATASLQTYVAGLRRALEPGRTARAAATVLVTTPLGYHLDIAADAVDAARFTATVERVHRRLAQSPGTVPRPPADLDANDLHVLRGELDVALAAWQGVPYAELRDADPVTAERARLDALWLVAQEDRALLRLASGEHAAVAAELGTLVRRHPLRESLCALHVLALVGSGAQGEALAALRHTRSLLADELGIDPGAALQELEAAVLRQGPELAWVVPSAGAPPASDPPAFDRPAFDAPASDPPASDPPAVDAPASESVVPDPPDSEPPGPDPGGDWPLVGRRPELAVLDSVLDAALDARAGTAVLIGEPGIGKSRLLQEAAARASARGLAVLTGRCSQDEGAPPLWPWTAVLRDLRVAVPDTGRPDDPDLLSAETAQPANGFGSGDAARFAVWEAVAERLVTAARQRPLLILLDDLHWADASSLKLLRHVVDTVRDGRLAIVGARRPLPEPSGALAAVGEAFARRGAARLELTGLDTDDVRWLLRSTTGREPSPEQAQGLRDRTGGNPFFLTEVVRMGAATDSAEIPSAVTDVVVARVGRLPEVTRSLLRDAAVLGGQFDTGLLAEVSGVSPERVLDDLDPAVAEGLVTEQDVDAYRFSHALVRDAVYAGIPASRRARRHASAARVLEDTAGPGRSRSTAAYHWLLSGPRNAGRAWRSAHTAAGEAAALYAWDEAAQLLGAAVTAQRADPEATDRQRYDLLRALADACRRSGDWAGLDAALLAAIERAEVLGDVELTARAAIGTVDAAVWHTRPQGQVSEPFVSTLRDVLHRLPSRDTELRCRVMLALAVELYFADAPREREALAEQGLAVARRLADPALLVWACTAAFLAGWRPGTAQHRWKLAGEALAAAQRTGDVVAEVTARVLLAITAQETGRIDEMWQEIGRARDLAGRTRLSAHLVALGWLEVPWLALRGDFAAAEQRFGETLSLMQRTSMPQTMESPAGAAMVIRMVANAVDGELVGQLRAVAAGSPLPLDANVIALMLRAGQKAEAQEWYAARGVPLPADDWFSVLNLCMAAEAAFGLGLPDLAAEVYERLAPFAGRPCSAGGAVALGPVDAFLALAAAAAGERLVATRHAEDALARCAQWQIPLIAAWIRVQRDQAGF